MNYKFGFYIVFLILIIFCIICLKQIPETSSASKTIEQSLKLTENLAKYRVIAIQGHDAINGDAVFFSLSGEKIEPCRGGSFIKVEKEPYSDNKQHKTTIKTENPNCSIFAIDPSPELRTAMKLSEKKIEGLVMKDGEEQRVVYSVSVTATSLDGDDVCTTTGSGGNQIRVCLKKSDFCQLMYDTRFNAAKFFDTLDGPPNKTDEQIKKLVLEDLQKNSGCTEIRT